MKQDRISARNFKKKELKRCKICTKNTYKNKSDICDDCTKKGYVMGDVVSHDSHG